MKKDRVSLIILKNYQWFIKINRKIPLVLTNNTLKNKIGTSILRKEIKNRYFLDTETNMKTTI